ncbi:MAG TPA: sulfotransferase [Actinomycetota bacterium]|nr:sulfotransferase [Actinomycetota bacterium]
MSVTPIFLLSLPRSGSTLVQRVLAGHRDIATAAEPWVLLPHLYATRERGIAAEYTQPIAARAIAEFLRSLPDGERDYRRALHDFGIDLYSRAAGPEKRYFLDKTPRYHYVIDDLLDVFPEAKSVFLWRNPLAVVASIVQTWAKGRWNVDRWQGDLRGLASLVDAYGSHRDSTIAVRYEDLVGDPARTWPRIFEYLDLPYADDLLTTFSGVRLEGSMGDPTGVDRYSTISTEPLEKWRSTLANPYRKRWCRGYLRWVGAERLAVMGYDFGALLEQLDEIGTSPRSVASDAVHGGYWSLAQRRKRAAFKRMAPRVR